MLIPFNLIGETYVSRNKKMSAQSTKNFYLEIRQVGDAREPVALHSLPGNKLFYTGLAPNRGKEVFKDEIYVVNGDSLYRVNAIGEGKLIGNIQGSGRVQMAQDARYLVIATGAKGYIYDGTTLTAINDVDWNNARTVKYFNKRFVFDTPVGFGVTDLGDPFTINALNTAEGESSPDSALGVFTFGQKIYLFGKKSLESWWNTGVGNPPFSQEDFTFNLGVSGSYAVDTNSNFAYLLGSDRAPYRFSGLSKQSIGNSAIGREFQEYADVSDCHVICCDWDNQHFVWFIFPSADRSWIFHEESNTWYQAVRGLENSRHCINGYVEAYGKKLITDHLSGNIYQLDWDTNDDNGGIMVRERTSSPINPKSLGIPGKRAFIQGVEIHLETGNAPAGKNPILMLSWSKDDGETWVSEKHLRSGATGDKNTVVCYREGMGYIDPHENMIIKIRMTDSNRWTLTGSNIDVTAGR